MDLSQAVQVCTDIAVSAGSVIMKVYNSDFDVDLKTDSSPLTRADTLSNELIASRVSEAYPGIPILSEETRDDGARTGRRFCFIVDPLDGTKEFIKRNGEFAVNIALADNGAPVLGVVYIPAKDELYYAFRNGGAWIRDKDGIERRLSVTDKLDSLIFIGSRSHSGERELLLRETHKDKIKSVISVGSSIKGCMVASGCADVYYRYGYTCEWDTAAMHCIVEQAGGIFRQIDGRPMTYNRENTLNEKGFFAVNRKENIWIYEEKENGTNTA